MKVLTEKIMETDLVNRVFNDLQLGRKLGGSDARRYGLVNRALKAGELHRVKRGLYVLDNKYRDYPLHPFALAQVLVPGSYVSLETALAHHGWIPEAVYTTASIAPGRKSKDYNHEKLGSLSFHPLAINKGHFLELVERLKIDGQSMMVAKPVRALMDLVCRAHICARSRLELAFQVDAGQSPAPDRSGPPPWCCRHGLPPGAPGRVSERVEGPYRRPPFPERCR